MTRDLKVVIAGVLMAAAIVLFGQPACRSLGQPAPPAAATSKPATRYVVACFQQPIENLAAWKARGCNAAVGPEIGNPPRTTAAKWCAEAERLGMGVIGNSSLLKDKFVPPNLIAWYVDDEPNEDNHLANGTGLPMVVAAQAQAFRQLKAGVPVICNLGGDKLTSAGPRDDALYEGYIRIPGAPTVWWQDWHVVNRQFDRYPIAFIGQALDYAKARGAKELGSHIETSWQELNNKSPKGRAPTPDEIEAEVNMALAHGATWICYFSTAERGSNGWPGNYDPTPPENVARITAINAKLNPPIVVAPPAPPIVQLPFPRVLNCSPTDIPGIERVYNPSPNFFAPTHLLHKRGLNDEVRGIQTQYAKDAAAAKQWLVAEMPEFSPLPGDELMHLATWDTAADRQADAKVCAETFRLLQANAGGRFVGVYGLGRGGWNDSLQTVVEFNRDLKEASDALPASVIGDYPDYRDPDFPTSWWERQMEGVRLTKRADPKKFLYLLVSPAWQYSAPEKIQGQPMPAWMVREQMRRSLAPQNPGRLAADGVIVWSSTPVPAELVKVIQEEAAAAGK